jgi:hypothetical protein
MAAVGDQIEVSSKSGPRSGVVTAVRGPMVIVRWSTGEDTSFVPGPGVLSVVKRRRNRSMATRGTSQVRARTGAESCFEVRFEIIQPEADRAHEEPRRHEDTGQDQDEIAGQADGDTETHRDEEGWLQEGNGQGGEARERHRQHSSSGSDHKGSRCSDSERESREGGKEESGEEGREDGRPSRDAAVSQARLIGFPSRYSTVPSWGPIHTTEVREDANRPRHRCGWRHAIGMSGSSPGSTARLPFPWSVSMSHLLASDLCRGVCAGVAWAG